MEEILYSVLDTEQLFLPEQGLLYTETDFLPDQISRKGQDHILMQTRAG